MRRGDPDAFDHLAREYAPRLFRTALHLVRSPADAEDLAQEALVRALPTIRRFESRAQTYAYLLRTLRNLWKNRLRSRSRSRVLDAVRVGTGSADEWTIDPPDGAPSAVDLLESDDAGAAVRAAVARLDPERRLTLILREVEELSYEEIAQATQVPVGTVRSRLARARDDLRRLLRVRR